MEKLYENIPVEEREEMLLAMSYRTEEKMVQKHFTPEEILDYRKQFTENWVAVNKAKVILKQAQDKYTESTKDLTKENTYLINNIQTGFVELNQQVYLFDDQENGVMKYYDSRGEFLESRRLTPEERQTRIKQNN